MRMKSIQLQPATPEQHFEAIARLMSCQETEPTTQALLSEWYGKRQERGIWLNVALCNDGEVCGFTGLYRDNLNLEEVYGMYLIVDQDFRRQGVGTQLYNHLLSKADELGARTLRTRVRDDNEEGIAFAVQRGFVEKWHSIEMKLDLHAWDEQQYSSVVGALQAQGFIFTNMAELGDTQEARHKLYELNNNAAAADPGSDGIPPWASFEEFELDVCKSRWYRPDGQIIAIDASTGTWVAMSAITVFEAADHAYNLFTGTQVNYRGRKLAQAAKTLALQKALTFGVETVRTSHNSKNAAMIAIDTKLGYVRTPGTFVMLKVLKEHEKAGQPI